MAVSFVGTYVSQLNIIEQRDSYFRNNITLELLSPLYPQLIQTQADVDAIVSDLNGELSLAWQQANNPGLLDIVSEPYSDDLGSGAKLTWIYSDMTAYNNMRAKYPIVFDWRVYDVVGVNLVLSSDGTEVAILSPKEWARWQWNDYAQIVVTRSPPQEI